MVEIIFILDMTGSMQPLAAETVIGVNSFIEEQKKVPDEANMTLITFNSNNTSKVYDCVDLATIQPMKTSDYVPDGMTPLLDTIGNAIDETGERLKSVKDEELPEKVIVVVMTDGEENFSRRYDRKQIFDMITRKKDEHKWGFIFLGANQDSYLEAGRLGVDKNDTHDWVPTNAGVKAAYASAGQGVSNYRN